MFNSKYFQNHTSVNEMLKNICSSGLNPNPSPGVGRAPSLPPAPSPVGPRHQHPENQTPTDKLLCLGPRTGSLFPPGCVLGIRDIYFQFKKTLP